MDKEQDTKELIKILRECCDFDSEGEVNRFNPTTGACKILNAGYTKPSPASVEEVKYDSLTQEDIRDLAGELRIIDREKSGDAKYLAMVYKIINALHLAELPLLPKELTVISDEDLTNERLTYLDGDEVDEAVLYNAMVHLESMDDHCYMLIISNSRHRWHLNIFNPSRRSKVVAKVFEDTVPQRDHDQKVRGE